MMMFLLLMVLLAYIALMSRPLAKASLAGADVAILRLKDAVAPENKQTRTKALDSSVAACGAVVIAFLTGFGIEARGIRFVPREAVPRRVDERRR
jgi:cbb3-type cytochrome oxidase subunit 3